MFSARSAGCQPFRTEFKEYLPSAARWRRFAGGIPARPERIRERCAFPFRQPTIWWDGTVVSCDHDNGRELPLGKIGERPFAEIWNSPTALDIRRRFLAGRDLPPYCQACSHIGSPRKDLFSRRFKASPASE